MSTRREPAIPDQMCFRVCRKTLLGSVQLMPLLASDLNRPLNFTQLEEAAAEIAITYRNAGWLVRA
jgi:hypothetical protein